MIFFCVLWSISETKKSDCVHIMMLLWKQIEFLFGVEFLVGQFIFESYVFIRLEPLRWVTIAYCIARPGLNLATAVRPADLFLLFRYIYEKSY